MSLPAAKGAPALMSLVKAVEEVIINEFATVPAVMLPAVCVVHGPPDGYTPILLVVPAAKFAFSSEGLVFHCGVTIRLLPPPVPSFTFQYRFTILVLSLAAGVVVTSNTYKP